MKNHLLVLISIFLISQSFLSQNFKVVEKSKLPVKEMYFGKESKTKTKYHEFEISELITVGEYKVFLEAMYKDSGETVYNKYVPQPTLNEKTIIDAFWSNMNFDKEPAIGITWESAQAYCKWSEKLQQPATNYAYRLPNVYEWIIFANQNQELNIKNFGLYSEWTINAMDESLYEINPKQNPINSFVYEHTKDDPQVMKRKIALGNNFMEKFKFPFDAAVRSYYADEGYRTIGFRVVRTHTKEK
jgi:formylglycine-generating enzyme required for sulfatase activity